MSINIQKIYYIDYSKEDICNYNKINIREYFDSEEKRDIRYNNLTLDDTSTHINKSYIFGFFDNGKAYKIQVRDIKMQ